MIFRKYNECVYCKSLNLKLEKKQFSKLNFYTDAIQSDLGITKKKFEELKVYRCQNCKNYQNNPWFDYKYARKIYSNIYGQHNRGWSNLINFFNKGQTPDHGTLFKKLNKLIKIRNYAEFNTPFTGLMINFFEEEYKKNLKFYKSIFQNTLKYLSSRQLAGLDNLQIKSRSNNAQKFLSITKKLKKKNFIKKKVNKYIYIDNSELCWGQNDNYKSVSSRSLSEELLDTEIINLHKKRVKPKYYLFGIFHSLDHTFEPSKIFNYALKSSKYVILYCHVDKKLEKQHLFSFSRDFLKFLKKKKIYTFDMTYLINKSFKTPELYVLCSKENFNNKIDL